MGQTLTHSLGRRTELMCTISARLFVALYAQSFTIGGYVAPATSDGGAVIRFPGSTLAFNMIPKHKLLPTPLASAASFVEYLASNCFGKSHSS